MASCGRIEDDGGEVSDATLSLIAKPKPGSCCSTKGAAQHKHSGGGGCNSASCACQSSTGGAGASCASTSAAAAAPASASGGAVRELMVSGGVPPKRMKESKVVGRRVMCYRCKEKRATVNARDQISCSECFTSLVASKIKSNLRMRCSLAKGANLLVAVSGGAASTCMAHVLSVACDPSAQKRMFFGFDMVYVDESAVMVGTDQEHADFNREVEQLYAVYPQRLIRVQLEDVMALGTDAEFNEAAATATPAASSTDAGVATAAATAAAAAPSSSSNRAALQSLFASLKDASDKADLRDLLRLRLLAHVARTRGFAQVVLGHDASRTAFDAFADTTKGRGSTVPLCVLSKEERFQAEFLYPLRDQVSSVVALYNHYQRLHPVFRPAFLTIKKAAQAGAGGINRLTHDFLCMLNAKFNGSVANIVSTVGKVALPVEFGAALTPDSHCSLCGRARVAAESAECKRTAHASVGTRGLTPANEAVLSSIPSCYGCTSLMRELTDASLLPPFVRRGQWSDQRGPDGRSAYPAPFNTLISAEAHRKQNAEMLRRKNEKRAEEQQRIRQFEQAEEEAHARTDPDPAASPDDGSSPVASEPHRHQGLQLQSRQDMKASIDEFLLPEGE